MGNKEMLQDVYQSFSILDEKYPRIKSNLEKCRKDIQAKCDGEQFIPKEEKKEKFKKLLTDMTGRRRARL